MAGVDVFVHIRMKDGLQRRFNVINAQHVMVIASEADGTSVITETDYPHGLLAMGFVQACRKYGKTLLKLLADTIGVLNELQAPDAILIIPLTPPTPPEDS